MGSKRGRNRNKRKTSAALTTEALIMASTPEAIGPGVEYSTSDGENLMSAASCGRLEVLNNNRTHTPTNFVTFESVDVQDVLREISIPSPLSSLSTTVISSETTDKHGSESETRNLSLESGLPMNLPIFSSTYVTERVPGRRAANIFMSPAYSSVTNEESNFRVNPVSEVSSNQETISDETITDDEYNKIVTKHGNLFQTKHCGCCTRMTGLVNNDTKGEYCFSKTCVGAMVKSLETKNEIATNIWIKVLPWILNFVENGTSFEHAAVTTVVTFVLGIFAFFPFDVSMLTILSGFTVITIISSTFVKIVYGTTTFDSWSRLEWNIPDFYLLGIGGKVNELIIKFKMIMLVEEAISSIAVLIIAGFVFIFWKMSFRETIFCGWMIILSVRLLRKKTKHLRLHEVKSRFSSSLRHSMEAYSIKAGWIEGKAKED